jgi:CheY-like chemotaxis protein
MCCETADRASNPVTTVGAKKGVSHAGTILVVEDEDLLRLAVSKALTKRGFSVLEACDGSAGMELIRAHKNDIDVVLLDVTLPGLSSREIFEEARRIRPDSNGDSHQCLGKGNSRRLVRRAAGRALHPEALSTC